MKTNKHGHYFKDVQHLDAVDVYRVLDLFRVSHPCLQHAVKKLLCAGGRGGKSQHQDVQEAMDSLARWQQMAREDERRFDELPEAPSVAGHLFAGNEWNAA